MDGRPQLPLPFLPFFHAHPALRPPGHPPARARVRRPRASRRTEPHEASATRADDRARSRPRKWCALNLVIHNGLVGCGPGGCLALVTA